MTPSSAASDLVRRFEGLRTKAYTCPAGKSTIGWGHTKGISLGMVCTLEQAETWLDEDLADAAAIVNRWVTAPLTQPQSDALCSFALNTGPGAPGAKDGLIWLAIRGTDGKPRHSTLLTHLNAGNYDLAAAEFPKWVYGGGKRLMGLVRRRQAERALFDSPPPSQVT